MVGNDLSSLVVINSGIRATPSSGSGFPLRVQPLSRQALRVEGEALRACMVEGDKRMRPVGFSSLVPHSEKPTRHRVAFVMPNPHKLEPLPNPVTRLPATQSAAQTKAVRPVTFKCSYADCLKCQPIVFLPRVRKPTRL